MENSSAVTIEGENYEVVDECIEEEEASNTMQQKAAENAEKNKSVEDTPVQNAGVSDAPVQNIGVSDAPIQNMDVSDAPVQNMGVSDTAVQNMDVSDASDASDQNIGVSDAPVQIAGASDAPVQNAGASDAPVQNAGASDAPVQNARVSDENKEQEGKTDCIAESTNTALMQENLDSRSHYSIANLENQCPQQPSTESIDFTADISLDQLEEQKDVKDEDVMHNLNKIEDVDLNSSDFQAENKKMPVEQSLEKEVSNEETTTVYVENPAAEKDANADDIEMGDIKKEPEVELKHEMVDKNAWYEQKLAEKEAIIKERLSKVARVLGISYPCYEKWLEHEEKLNGSPLCKLKPSRRCCLDKPYSNRWKFICNRKKLHDSAQKVDNSDASNKQPEIVWKMEASGAWGVNINNESEFPPFVLRAVKIFEDFLQTEQLNTQSVANENSSEKVVSEVESKKEVLCREGRQDWSWLVVRCNSMDELMLFATGKNINRATMDRLKQVYESGPGKDCNVKSLYCKSTNRYEDITVTDTTFLVGSEALDEIVGGLKVQLAPKTNFWSNTAGAENVANAVMDLLAPTPKTTVLEVGCGIGLIGLMMASKCQQVIGVDSPSEVEEAEMICELNNIKNASFIMGSPTDVTTKIVAAVKNRRTCAVINANTNIGRAIEVMSCLRKIPSLKRIVMITTLTKQSVRAILELARPGDQSHGSPFVPILACVVDTLPIGPHFEAVILMQRRMISKLIQGRPQKVLDDNIKKPEIKIAQDKTEERNSGMVDKKVPAKVEPQVKKTFNKTLMKYPVKKSKIPTRKPFYPKKVENPMLKGKFKGKRSHSPDKGDAPPKKMMKKFGKFAAKPWQTDLPMKREWNTEGPELRTNPLYEKKLREHKEQDLRERLSNNRLNTDIAQTVKEHQALLEIAKEKLSGPAPTVDVNTAKQLQNMLNMVLEQTNKLQSQLPRTVWDRIAPLDNANPEQMVEKQDESILKGRYVQELSSLMITTPNKKFEDAKPMYKKYNNLPPLEPNTIMPVGPPIPPRQEEGPFHVAPERYQQSQENTWNRDNRSFERNWWNNVENMKKQTSPMRREHRVSPPKRLSPKRPLLSPPRRPCSPPRRHFSPGHRPMSPMYRQRSPIRRQMSPARRPVSPRRPSPPRRSDVMMNCPMSSMRRPSPPRRQMSPTRPSPSPPRRQPSPMRRPMSPPRRQIPSPNRLACGGNNREDMLLNRRQGMSQDRQQPGARRLSPQRLLFDRPTSPPRRQQSPQRRQMSPARFNDEWDIPSRGAIEQSTWIRPVDRMPEQNLWRTEKASTSNSNWNSSPASDKRRKTFNEKSNRPNTWNNGGGNTWTTKQTCAKPMGKDTWISNSDVWPGNSNMAGSSSSSWNIQGKDSFAPSKKPWIENKKQGRWATLNIKDTWKQSGDKEDINDLPDDAKDPWGDDGGSDLKERWHKYDGAGTSSTWIREDDKQPVDLWSKNNKDSWQNKGVSFGVKPQWPNNGVQSLKSRWLSQSDIEKKTLSTGWQSGNSGGSWQLQNSTFQSQRPFSTNQFKGLY